MSKRKPQEDTVTPLDEIIIELSANDYSSDRDTQKKVFLCIHQLSLLRVVYILMIEDDFIEKMKRQPKGERTLSLRESYLHTKFSTGKIILLYNQFLYILNQFARALKKEGFIRQYSEFPNFYRNRFYRNCVGEHWETYIRMAEVGQGFSIMKGKAGIPSVEGLVIYEERKKICEDLITEFSQSSVDVSSLRVNSGTSFLSIDRNYGSLIFGVLEKIDQNLITGQKKQIIPKKLISLIFQYGFPAPIVDVETYLVELILFVNKITKNDF